MRIYRFWEEVTRERPTQELLWEEYRLSRIRYRGKLTKAKILVRSFFVGKELEILTLLFTSGTPIPDIVALYSIDLVEAYRRVHYLRRVLTEYLGYFSQRSYKKADRVLRASLSRRNYDVFNAYLRCRDPVIVSRVLGTTSVMMRIRIRIIDRVLKSLVAIPEVFDLFVFWRRMRKIRKTYYGGGWKKLKGPELDKIPTEVQGNYGE